MSQRRPAMGFFALPLNSLGFDHARLAAEN
jgi:hypothetical protein